MIRQKRNQKFKKLDLKIEKLLPGLEKNVLLKNQTTFRVGGRAKYFFRAKTKQDLIKVLKMVKKINLPFFILGGGSNLLVDDKGYKGLVIKFQVPCLTLPKDKVFGSRASFKFQNNKIISRPGTLLGELVNLSVKKGLTGLEWAIGIPGTIGGAIWGNSGAFGHSIKETVKLVEVFDFKTFKIKKLKQKDCKFNYRDSIFRQNPDLIIFSVELQLRKGDKKKIEKKN